MLLFEPIDTLPKVTDEGLALKFGVPAATPVPLIGIERVPGEALLMIDTDPVATPTLTGEKLNVADVDCDGFNVNGVVIGEEVKPVPDTVTWLTVIADVDEFVTVMV